LNFSSNEQRVHAIESNPPIQQNGNVIRIGHMEDPELRRGISVSYEVTVPAETKLRSQTGSLPRDRDRSPLHVSAMRSVRTPDPGACNWTRFAGIWTPTQAAGPFTARRSAVGS
jgi:hypothetical protein